MNALNMNYICPQILLFTNYKMGDPDINLYGNSATMTNYQYMIIL